MVFTKILRNTRRKFSQQGIRIVLLGYIPTDYIFLRTKDKKFHEIANVRFNEKLVLRNIWRKDNIANLNNHKIDIKQDEWFIKFGNDSLEVLLETEEEQGVKRKRGRPKNNKALVQENFRAIDEELESMHKNQV